MLQAPNAAASSNGAAAARAAAPEPAPAPSPSGGRGGSGGGGGGGGVSDRLKAANKQLVERIKRQLSGSAFDTFRQQSLLFMRGELGAEEYHGYMVGAGTLRLSMAADCERVLLMTDALVVTHMGIRSSLLRCFLPACQHAPAVCSPTP